MPTDPARTTPERAAGRKADGEPRWRNPTAAEPAARQAGARAGKALAKTRFSRVQWVAETGSTNADALDMARDGAPEGCVLVADHQSAGRGRHGRAWVAAPGASLLVSVLLRPPAAVAGIVPMAVALAMADAIELVAGVSLGLKWPNDLVIPATAVGGLSLGAGHAAPNQHATGDRKLAGILAEADWPAGSAISAGWRQPGEQERVAVVVGIGVNVSWPASLPDELSEVAVALNQVTDRPVDRVDLLVAFLRGLDARYGDLVAARTGRTDDRAPLLDEWRLRSATLGCRVRVDLGASDVEGLAVDVTSEGHLVVETLDGKRRTFAAGDVVHLRSA